MLPMSRRAQPPCLIARTVELTFTSTSEAYSPAFGGSCMKSFVLAMVFAVAAAYAASLVLETYQRPVAVAYTTGGVRL
jgi:hypothetical protein